MTSDELEYSISQYLDGNLPPLQRAALEEQLATDAEARALLDEYRQLDAALKKAMPVPPIAWDRLADQLSKALAAEEAPIRHYSIGSMGWAGRLAVAASLLLAIGIAVQLSHRPTQLPRSAPVMLVSGPAIEQSSGPVLAQISIGPSPAVTHDWRAAEEVVSRPTVVLIDRALTSGQDGDLY